MSPHAIPLFRLLLPLAIGITLGNAAPMPWPGMIWVLTLGSLLAIGWSPQSFTFSRRHHFGIFSLFFLFLWGYYRIIHADERLIATHLIHQVVQKPGYCIGIVDEAPSKGGARTHVILRAEMVGPTIDSLKACTGKILLLIESDTHSDTIQYGQRLGVRATIQGVRATLNPQAFDYQRYLARQNIYHSAFVDPDAVFVLSSGHGSRWWRMAYTSRDWLLTLLKQHFPTQNEYAVASALLVGYKDALTDDLRTAYTETGSIHALVVSGSHVSALFFGLMLLLGRLPVRGHHARWIELLLALPLIWSFTFLTGATASVMRAAIMFSIYLFGKALWRDASAWNVWAASAIILLFFQPGLLFDAGFQLSYSAVAGMLFFYPRFYRLSPVFPFWVDWLWKPLLLGCAAQLGTLPLSLYYFHQFPVYFWLSGWVVMLGGGFFLAGGTLLVIFHFLSSDIANLIGWVMFQTAKLLNWLIFQIQALPGNVIEHIWLTAAGIVLAFTAIIAFGAALETRQGRWIAVMVASLAILSSERLSRFMHHWDSPKMVIYHAGKNRLIDFFDQNTLTTISDTLSNKQILFVATNNRLYNGCAVGRQYYFGDTTSVHHLNFLKKSPFIGFYDKKMLCLDGKYPINEQHPYPKDIRIVLFSHNPKISPTWCLQQFPNAVWIFDATNSKRWVEKWKNACREMHPAFYDIAEQGAWVL